MYGIIVLLSDKEKVRLMKYMDFDQYRYEESKLLSYGFIKQENGYVYSEYLNDHEYYCRLEIINDALHVDVYDAFDELFLPFYVLHHNGAYVANVKAEVETIIANVFDACFEKCDIRQLLSTYAQNCFHTIPEYPWENNTHCVLKTSKQHKWYALFMHIPYETLGIKQSGNVDVVNIKADPLLITKIIDHQRYFPAYHMNKKYWLTVLLNRNTDIEQVKKLIHDSYDLAEGKK